jgi:cell division protein FtsN
MSKSNNNNQTVAIALAMAAAASLALYFYMHQEDEETVKASSKSKKLDDVPSSPADRSLDVDSNLTPKTSNATPEKNPPKKLDEDARLEEKRLHARIEELDKKGKALFRNRQVRFELFWTSHSQQAGARSCDILKYHCSFIYSFSDSFIFLS